uniref:Transposase n=2 Tax=Bursaphelenchus xylophilus TaxID=6326 RepID=A0A1I7SNJ5_BURXY
MTSSTQPELSIEGLIKEKGNNDLVTVEKDEALNEPV